MLKGSSGEQELRKKHAQHYLGVAERVEPDLRKTNQIAWLKGLYLEHKNLTSALFWFRNHNNVQEGLRMVAALGWYWLKRGLHSEGWRWHKFFLDIADDRLDGKPKTKALFHSSWLGFSGPADA